MNQQPAKQQHKPPRPSLLGSSIFMLFKMTLISLASWFVLTLWFTGQCFFKGTDFALAQADGIVISNTSVLENSQSELAKILAAWFYCCHEKLSHLLDQYNFLRNTAIQTASNLLLTATEIDLSRLLVFLLALPLLILIGFVFMTDGLVSRDIRKFQGVRESTFLFHRAKHLLNFCFFILFFIYLSIPFALSPILFLTLQGVLLGLLIRFSAAHFKKYV